MSTDRPTFQTLKLMPTYAVSYYRPVNGFTYNNLKVPKYNKHKGQVSDKAAVKIRNAVNWMLLFSEDKYVYSKAEDKRFRFKLNFITLTLPSEQVHTDDFVKERMLVPFIEWMTKTVGAQMWLWKAEAQAEGNIHFHITSHVFIHWRSVRAKWNKICAKHGYCKVYQDGSNDKGNAATQIKAAKNPEQVGGYLAAYISKKDKVKWKIKVPKGLPRIESTVKSDCANNYIYSRFSVLKRPIEGRLWACSNNIASIGCFVSEMDERSFDVWDMTEDVANISDAMKFEKYFTVFMYGAQRIKDLPSTVRWQFEEVRDGLNLKEVTQITVDSFM